MSELIITERSNIVAIADAVRSKTGSDEDMTFGEIVDGINSISGTDMYGKEVLLYLLKKAVYTEDVSSAIETLEEMWYGDTVEVYDIINNLTDVVNSNEEISIYSGQAYTATLTAIDGYKLDSVVVTMGGVDVTASVYDNGIVSIPSVTGHISILAIAGKQEMVYLYDNGDECEDVTGGWIEKGMQENPDLAQVSTDNQLHIITDYITKNQCASLSTAKAIDISHYSKINVIGTFEKNKANDICYLYICEKVENANTGLAAYGNRIMAVSASVGTVTINPVIDLTSLDFAGIDKTEVYIALTAASYGNSSKSEIVIDSIYLE